MAKELTEAMLRRMLPTRMPIPGTATLRRSAFLRALRAAHGGPQWQPNRTHECIQCGGGRHSGSGKRCQQCHFDNALCKILRPGPRGTLFAELLAGESKGLLIMVDRGKWTLHPGNDKAWTDEAA